MRVRAGPKVHLLVFNDLIPGLENWCVLHLDALGHLHDSLQQLCAVADGDKGRAEPVMRSVHSGGDFTDT